MLRKTIADVLFMRGAALLESREPQRAVRYLGLAARLAPSKPDYLVAAALAAFRSGDRDRAARYCERAVALDPQFEPAHRLLFDMFLHGEPHHALLARIHRHLKPRTYVEIGVENGVSFTLALPDTLALGVDPEPAITYPMPANGRVFAETSDAFFSRDVRAELGGLAVDLAFIDGMHHFEFALRDFVNLERLCAPGSTILIHDCFPHDRRTAQRERAKRFWTGDVWKLFVLLKKYRPDLSVHTIATPESGLGIVRNLDSSSQLLARSLDRLCREFLALDYSYLEKDRAGKLNLFPNDWPRIRSLLDAAPTRSARQL